MTSSAGAFPPFCRCRANKRGGARGQVTDGDRRTPPPPRGEAGRARSIDRPAADPRVTDLPYPRALAGSCDVTGGRSSGPGAYAPSLGVTQRVWEGALKQVNPGVEDSAFYWA